MNTSVDLPRGGPWAGRLTPEEEETRKSQPCCCSCLLGGEEIDHHNTLEEVGNVRWFILGAEPAEWLRVRGSSSEVGGHWTRLCVVSLR